MALSGICPACKKSMSKIELKETPLSFGTGQNSYKGITFQCPSCHTVLGVSFDPAALKKD